jgi:hypothetical protein
MLPLSSGSNKELQRGGKQALLPLKMEAIYSYETSVDFQLTTRRYIPGDSTLQ